MVALFVLGFFIFFIVLDYIINYKKYHNTSNDGIFDHANEPGLEHIGLTMADGGKKVEKK